jgi:dihydrofolate reductase
MEDRMRKLVAIENVTLDGFADSREGLGMLDNPEAKPSERVHAEWVHNVDKVVFSTTLESATWANSRLIKRNVGAEVATLKASPGGAMAIYASPKLVHGLVDLGLIDEFRVLVHPVTLGRGTPLFHDGAKLDLELLESKTFDSGAVYVRYRVV